MKNLIKNNFLSISHFPTVVLIFGYICFWIELYIIRHGRGVVSPLAYALSLLFFVLLLFLKRRYILKSIFWITKGYKQQDKFMKYSLIFSLLFIILIIIVVSLALLLPPHLHPEFDALNYHLSLPRQHLILGSFRHIEWSSGDLFLLPLQFSLAPYWFIKDIPSKFIQIFFIFGLIAVSVNLVRLFSRNNFSPVGLMILAVFGSHGLGIQMPTAMLDILICYLGIAFLDSLLNKNFLIAGVEMAFLFWSKPFMVLQIPLMIFILFIVFLLFRIFKFKYILNFDYKNIQMFNKNLFLKIIAIFLVSSLFVGFPFIAKSVYYTGTPLFPFMPGILKFVNIDKTSSYWQSLIESSKFHINAARGYGLGTSFSGFIKHLWILAVPEEGVNNRFDYPLGLPYLLFLGPFIYFFVRSIKHKELPIMPSFIIIYWIVWWFAAQQARFLYIPLVLMFIVVSSLIDKPLRILVFILNIALLFNFISIFRANFKDLLLPKEEVLRKEDREIVEMNKRYLMEKDKNIVNLNNYYIAYAQFPVKVIKENLPWVLKTEGLYIE